MRPEWINLTEDSQLETAINESNTKPVIIYKHSTTCGICLQALDELETNFDQIKNQVSFYYLDLLTYRPLSNLIAERLATIHQSPQILLVKDGKVIYSVTHLAIKTAKIKDQLNQL